MTEPRAEMDRMYEKARRPIGRVRDRIGWAIAVAGFAIATPWYRTMLRGLIIQGMESSARVPAPTVDPDWARKHAAETTGEEKP